MFLFFTSCLLGTATLRDQAYRKNLIDDVYMDESGFICESILEPGILRCRCAIVVFIGATANAQMMY